MTHKSLALVATLVAGAGVPVAGAPPSALHEAATPTTRPVDQSLLVEPQDGLTPVYRLISSARKSLDMTMYELDDPTAEADLAADARRGVDVRVLLDSAYRGGEVNKPAYSWLASRGVHVAWAGPGTIFHQKTVTVDNARSLIMTGNLTARYYTSTRDFALLDSSAPDVATIVAAFDADWAGKPPTGEPSGSGDLVWSPGSEPDLVSLISSARHSVVTESEEMDNYQVEEVLEADARRGVDVTVVMTRSYSWERAFSRLGAAGVHVLTHSPYAALYIHAKDILVDWGYRDARAFVGSENYSTASMDYNRELGIVTSERGVLSPLAAALRSDERSGTPWP